MKKYRLIVSGLVTVLFSLVLALPASAIVLPMPGGDMIPTITNIPYVDGIPVASPHDDFWSYSNQILRAIQKENPEFLPLETYGSFDFATGTGGLDVLLYTGAGTQDRNLGVGPESGFNFEDPVSSPAGAETMFSGWWGQDDQLNDGSITDVNGPVTVGQVLDYLDALTPGNTIPAFYMDLNQTGASTILTFTGQVQLFDGGGDLQHTWAFDNTFQPDDGDFDVDSPVSTPLPIDELLGDSGTDYGPIDHNKGSGKADFIAFAPTMDLSEFDRTWLFVVNFYMTNLNNGFEEIYLTGLGNQPPPPPIPEPSTIVLLGAGLLGLGYCARRRQKK